MKNEPARGPSRTQTLVFGVFLTGTVVAILAWQAYSTRIPRLPQAPVLLEGTKPVAVDRDVELRIEAFCGDCHALPLAKNFPRHAWYEKVRRGYHFYAQSGRADLDPPPVHLTVDYYRSRAPEQLVFSGTDEAKGPLGATFAEQRIPLEGTPEVPPAVAHLRWARLDPEGKPVLLACDMRHGTVAALELHRPGTPRRILARLNNPCHVETCDLDADGMLDMVIADLGSFLPDDHERGRVVWLKAREPGNTFEPVVLASGLGRVADARPADFDNDGDLDLVVADFGLHRTGKLLLLENVASDEDVPSFEARELDARPGTIHVPIADLHRDGLPDFVALLSQEYEQVNLFLNKGEGRFQLQNLWTGPDLTFGSTGVELVDLDRDDDPDVVYSNGDAFDNNYVNPSHGIQWLENRGELEFSCHRLADMPGVHRALAADIDSDGDLDLIASSFLPAHVQPADLDPRRLPSLLCLEQTSPGVFARHTLETGSPYHAALEVGDFDDDGDLDFAAGVYLNEAATATHGLAIWWNEPRGGQ